MSLFGFLKRENACRFLADPEDKAAKKYQHFKELLSRNDEVLDALAALEQAYYGGEAFTMGAARRACLRIGEAVEGMAKALESLSQGRYPGMLEALGRILGLALNSLTPLPQAQEGPLTVPLGELTSEQSRLAGGKALNLARVRNELTFPTPDGFVLTTAGFAAFMAQGGLDEFTAQELDAISPLDLPDLEARCQRIRERILSAQFPPELGLELSKALDGLARRIGDGKKLAVRSSAVGEDGPASFAGQYDSVLDVAFGDVEMACKQVFASKYSPRAVLYRLRMGYDDSDAPMAVLVLEMVEAFASGVLYTADPSPGEEPHMRVDAVFGLGDKLVSGETLPFEFVITHQGSSKDAPLVASRSGSPSGQAPVTETQAAQLGAMGLKLEEHFGSPQDVEWCLTSEGSLVIVQSRPLDVSAEAAPEAIVDLSGRTVLLEGGVPASPGAASGPVMLVTGILPENVAPGAILVAMNAAPELAALLDRAGGIVTELGGAASHLASVTREMGIPALFAATGCMKALADGQIITLDATGKRVLDGSVEELLATRRTTVSKMVGSPMHRRLRAALDRIAPLTLTDPQAPNFTPAGCETLHDLVRFAHETGMRSMFGLRGHADEDDVLVARLKAKIPLTLYCVDLGGGLKENLTTCDDITPEDIRSIPMQAIWKGFTHPGITWSGTVAFDARSFMTLLASSATAEVGGGTPGGDSYAMLAREYVNLSARFGYHFANIDAYCGEEATKNHVNLRFAGGAGGFSGKCMRVAFLARVLSLLGFTVEVSGDVLDASFKGAPQAATQNALDQLGRLLASSRLLDMAITGQAEAEAMAQGFLNGDYDLLSKRAESPLPGFHLTEGDWERLESPPLPDLPGNGQGEPSTATPSGQAIARQDGSKWAPALSTGFAGLMGRFSGQRYQRFLDSVGAYFHFPLAVAKGSDMGDGRASVMVRPVFGSIDQAGGLAFAIRTAGTYLVLRINALENNLILFEFVEGTRTELASASVPVSTGVWRELAVEVLGGTVTGFLDGKPYVIHHFEKPPQGLLGLWTKADSVTDFTSLTLRDAKGERIFPI
jgi:pyruvate,water dikinase